MSIDLGKILNSESHLLYNARIYDESECSAPPKRQDYAFGTFVLMQPHQDTAEDTHREKIVGIISNSRLLNPESGNFGPRLTIPHEQNAVFAPDYLNEVGVVVSILLLGQLRPDQSGKQGVPPHVLPVGCTVRTLSTEEYKGFHYDENGRFQLRYYPLLAESGPGLAGSLLSMICEQLMSVCSPPERRILTALQKNAAWQSTLGNMR
ncbi:MAG: hypothetical protein CL920_33330 [Deltaproteobacteria bacterium]|nr:hypothetical protein [Deltaproteobacteria bacterium]MBU53607.1 hypothetical protein [Deltaproteobacteria bacterium]